MELVEYRSVTKYLHLQGYSPSDIFQKMVQIYGEKCLRFNNVSRCKIKAETEFILVMDEDHKGHPIFCDNRC